MEGQLNKWTNVMKGWQKRWFVLDPQTALLSYYTSRDKMSRGWKRGCIRMHSAMIGIDDEESSMFSITADGRTFHLQSRDPSERDAWVTALERATLHGVTCDTFMAQYERHLTEADTYLQLLIGQREALEQRRGQYGAVSCGSSTDPLRPICQNIDSLLDSIKHAIVRLQISKNQIQSSSSSTNHTAIGGDTHHSAPSGGSLCNHRPETQRASGGGGSTLQKRVPGHVTRAQSVCVAQEPVARADYLVPASLSPSIIEVAIDAAEELEISFSSSEDDWFDPEGSSVSTSISRHASPISAGASRLVSEHQSTDGACVSASADTVYSECMVCDDTSSEHTHQAAVPAHDGGAATISWAEYERAYDEDLADTADGSTACSSEAHGSVISHLLSQIRIGMDLTQVVLPTFILERRSLLEMYADFFAHSDLFCSIPQYSTPRQRMIQVLKWYLSAFHAGRSSDVAKKPYNPILGEVFKCVFDMPDNCKSSNASQTTPVNPCTNSSSFTSSRRHTSIPWAADYQVSFVAEQVSHHPPVSAFYAEHVNNRIVFGGHIWTKSKFLGLSVAVHNVGRGIVHLLDHDERYVVTFPSGYGRSILGVPWMELGGSVSITCARTAYSASVEFHTKPFYGGRRNRISGSVLDPHGQCVLSVCGDWNGVMRSQLCDESSKSTSEVFVDTVDSTLVRKKVRPLADQEDNESRRLWRDVTYNLKRGDISAATEAKTHLEKKQREEAKLRCQENIEWKTKLFSKHGDDWVYNYPLSNRESQFSN